MLHLDLISKFLAAKCIDIEAKELHVLNVEENTHVKMRQDFEGTVTF